MDLTKIFGERPANSHKGNFGSVMVVSGSKLYTGSATLAAVGAVRSGADLVTVVAPQRAADVAANSFFDLITYPLKGDYLTSKHSKDIFDLMMVRKVNSVVIGCGMGKHRLTITAINSLISKINIPMVLDADALFAISQNTKVVMGKHIILTPHIVELTMLLGEKKKIADDFESRLTGAKEAALKYKCVVLLKGNVDIITDGTNTITNNSGCAYMTKGGFGDILAGVCGALLARGVGIFEAAHVGAFINGKAGEYAADHFGEGLAASDALGFIPRVIHTSGK